MRYILSGIFFLVAGTFFAQENPSHESEVEKHHLALKPKDSTSLADSFLKAHWEVHARSFFMSTTNEGDLKDDHALAAGAGIGVVTQPFYGFQAGLSGFFVYNIYSSNIDQPDPLTNLSNRYEVGLFDIENPANKNDLDRLEELYLKYNLSKSAITFGKIHLNTPFINPQDGRMRPTIAEGFWLNINESKKIGINGGWIYDISPRSTVRWYTLANSIGLNPSGLTTEGLKSDYHEHITSSGMGIANIYFTPNDKLKLNIWNGFLDNVMNTAMIEVNYNHTINTGLKMYEGLIFLHQDAINYGGNADQSETYINKGAQSNVVSAQVGLKNSRFNTSVNYTHITGDGRYLMPREWGKEPFYTFLPRERNEGLGNVHACVIKGAYTSPNTKFRAGLGYGYYHLPDVKDVRLNKYALPSYHQFNADATYAFKGVLKGLELRALLVYKLQQGEDYDNLKVIYNKVNLWNVNFILDFKF